jgi:enamine deaminase RidA (YjgF/YER057c/UK114 family)
MKSNNRRNFLGHGALLAAGAGAAVAVTPQTASAQDKPVKKVIYKDGKKPEKTPRFSSTVQFGNLLFIAGVGAHFKGDIKAHTKHVLDEIQQQLEGAGSSMEKVLKCNVYLAHGEDFEAMNEVYTGRWGSEPPVRTTIAAAWIPGDSLIEIDVIASI